MKRERFGFGVLYDYLWIIGGCALYAFGFNCFFAPNDIAYGGLTGLAMVLNRLSGVLPVGVLIIILNVPLFLAGWRLLGGKFLVRSLFAMLVSSVMIDALKAVYTFPAMEPLLACVYGGVLLGAALGVIFLKDATTGGTDIAARLLKLKFAYLPMGRLILILDLAVIAVAALVFRNVNSALYGVIALYISSIVMDFVFYGLDTAKVAYIISDRHEQIAEAIQSDLDRGVTLLHGEGAYSGDEKRVILCAFKKQQIVELKSLVKATDPKAFMIVCEAHEVLGFGFGSYDKQ